MTATSGCLHPWCSQKAAGGNSSTQGETLQDGRVLVLSTPPFYLALIFAAFLHQHFPVPFVPTSFYLLEIFCFLCFTPLPIWPSTLLFENRVICKSPIACLWGILERGHLHGGLQNPETISQRHIQTQGISLTPPSLPLSPYPLSLSPSSFSLFHSFPPDSAVLFLSPFFSMDPKPVCHLAFSFSTPATLSFPLTSSRSQCCLLLVLSSSTHPPLKQAHCHNWSYSRTRVWMGTSSELCSAACDLTEFCALWLAICGLMAGEPKKIHLDYFFVPPPLQIELGK